MGLWCWWLGVRVRVAQRAGESDLVLKTILVVSKLKPPYWSNLRPAGNAEILPVPKWGADDIVEHMLGVQALLELHPLVHELLQIGKLAAHEVHPERGVSTMM